MKIKLALLLVLFCFPLSTMACECSPVTSQNQFVKKSYDKADIVFLGIAKAINDESVTFSVIEVLKGQYKESTLIIPNNGSCSIVPKKNEMWLIYLERQEQNNEYSTNMCFPNRNYGINSPLERVPAPFFSKEDSLYNSFKEHKEVLLANELNSLRQKRILNEMKNVKESYLLIQYGIIIIGILSLLTTVLYLIRKKK